MFILVYRSLRQGVDILRHQAAEKEEDFNKTQHSPSSIQRGACIRSDDGITSTSQPRVSGYP